MARPTKYDPKYCDEAGIYALHCPQTGEIRYVGRSKNIASRVKRHKRMSTKDDTHYGNWIRSLSEKPFASVLELTDNTIEREIFWIRKLRASGHRLVNTGSGGEGATDDPVQRLIRKMRNMFRGNEAVMSACDQLKASYLSADETGRQKIASDADKLWRLQ